MISGLAVQIHLHTLHVWIYLLLLIFTMNMHVKNTAYLKYGLLLNICTRDYSEPTIFFRRLVRPHYTGQKFSADRAFAFF